MSKYEIAKILTNIKFGNWVLTGFKGDELKTKKAIYKILISKPTKMLIEEFENIAIL